jgi:hypothetical protein
MDLQEKFRRVPDGTLERIRDELVNIMITCLI